MYWACRCMDVQQQTADECWESAVIVTRYKTATGQAFSYWVVLAVGTNPNFYDGVEPRCPNRRSAEHGQSCSFTLPVMLFLAASTLHGLVMFSCSHLEQSTSSFKTVFLLGLEICAETENLLCQLNDLAHLRTIYFALYKCTLLLLLS